MSEWQKYPAEDETFGIEFVNKIESGETLSAPDIKIYELINGVEGTETTSTMLQGSPAVTGSTKVVFDLIAGTSGKTYVVKVKATGSAGHTYQQNKRLHVKEVT